MGAGCRLTLAILAPDGSVATGCRNSGVTSVASCSSPSPTASFKGRWQNVDIPVPSDYACVQGTPPICTYRVRLTGGQPRDVSTCTANFAGPRFHLVP